MILLRQGYGGQVSSRMILPRRNIGAALKPAGLLITSFRAPNAKVVQLVHGFLPRVSAFLFTVAQSVRIGWAALWFNRQTSSRRLVNHRSFTLLHPEDLR